MTPREAIDALLDAVRALDPAAADDRPYGEWYAARWRVFNAAVQFANEWRATCPVPTTPGLCAHGRAYDVHCCNCHSGFLFDADSCVCSMPVDRMSRAPMLLLSATGGPNVRIQIAIDSATLDLSVDLPLGAVRPTIQAFLDALPQGTPASVDSQARVDQAAGRMHDSNATLKDAIDRAAIGLPNHAIAEAVPAPGWTPDANVDEP